MADLIREALENLVRQHDGLPQVLAKLRRQGLAPDHPTVTATIEGHRVCMDRAWQQAREAIARTPHGVTVLPVKTERGEPPMDAGGGEDRGGGR